MFQGRAIFCGTLACTAHRARASRRSSSAASRPGGHARLQSNGSGGPSGVYEIAGKSPGESVGDSEDAGILEPSEEMQGTQVARFVALYTPTIITPCEGGRTAAATAIGPATERLCFKGLRLAN